MFGTYRVRSADCMYIHSQLFIYLPHAVDIYDVGVAQLYEAVVLRPKVGQSRFSFGEGQVMSYPLGHHAPPPILACIDRAKRPVGNVLRGGECARGGQADGWVAGSQQTSVWRFFLTRSGVWRYIPHAPPFVFSPYLLVASRSGICHCLFKLLKIASQKLSRLNRAGTNQ